MRRVALAVVVLAGAVGLVSPHPRPSAAAAAAVAAVSVQAAPPISPVTPPIGLSADGNVVAGRAALDPGRPYTVFDRAAGTSVDETGFSVLTRDGRHLASFDSVRVVGGNDVALSPLPSGTQSLNSSDASADGRVVLSETSDNSTQVRTVFVRTTGGGASVDLDAGLPTANGLHRALSAAISADGRYASFIHGVTPGYCSSPPGPTCAFEVYRRDLIDGTVVPISRRADGTESDGQERLSSISDDGRYVAFVSDATDLPGATLPGQRLYRHDVVTGRTVLVAGGIPVSGTFYVYAMSGDGSRFAYATTTAVQGRTQVRVADLAEGTDLPLVRQDDTAEPICTTDPIMSRNGRVVLFRSCAAGAVLEPAGAPALTNVLGLATLPSLADSVGFVGITPYRIYDSRDGQTDTVANLAAGSEVSIAVGGHAGIPTDATAAVLNVTVTNAAGPGFVTVWPCGKERPTASNVNYAAGQTIPNAVLAGLAPDGTVCLYTHNAADLIVDVAGSFGATSSYGSAPPLRVLDTRADENPFTPPSLAAGSVTVLDVATLADLPASAAAVTLNVTVTDPAAAGFVTVFPCGADVPTASNLNYTAGQTIPNAVISQLGADGTVCLYTRAAADLIVDVNGFFTAGSGFVGLRPARLFDSRDGQTDLVANLAGGSVTTLQVGGAAGLPTGVSTAVLNVTVTNPASAGFVTVYPCGGDPPTASNLNYTAGETVANLVVSNLSPTGSVCLFTKAAADLIVDVTGYVTG